MYQHFALIYLSSLVCPQPNAFRRAICTIIKNSSMFLAYVRLTLINVAQRQLMLNGHRLRRTTIIVCGTEAKDTEESLMMAHIESRNVLD
jgi:UDP-N-acetylmuramate-alanine ligase